MKVKFKAISFLLLLNLFGCSSMYIVISKNEVKKYTPIGIFLLSSTQIVDIETNNHKVFITGYGSKIIEDFFSIHNYPNILLNNKINEKDVFQKYPGTFNIDEKIIAKKALEDGCGIVLIVYYSFFNQFKQEEINHELFGQCSLYMWLVNAKSGEILQNAHTILNSLNDYRNSMFDPNDNVKDEQIYESFIRYITLSMLSKIEDL
jgi:hypothetical protein